MNKSSALRIPVEPVSHQEFLDTCKAQDVKASKVLRAFMRYYVFQNAVGKPVQLFMEDTK